MKVSGERGKEGSRGKRQGGRENKIATIQAIFPSNREKGREKRGKPSPPISSAERIFGKKDFLFHFFPFLFFFCRSQSLSCLMSIGVSAFPRLPPAAASGVRRVSEPSPNLRDYSNSGLIITPREKARKKMRVKFQPWELFLN